jgi:Holliday junction resolvasome RuvABC DNA-binding subunit
LEIDHKKPRALGGEHTVANTRLLCRGHNQWEAERVFGKEHVEEARLREKRRLEVGSALRSLGFRADEVRKAVANVQAVPLEDALRAALRFLAPASV